MIIGPRPQAVMTRPQAVMTRPQALMTRPQVVTQHFVSLCLTFCKTTMSKSKDPRYFLLQTIPTDDDRTITGCRLPTARQVLLCFLAYHDSKNNKSTKRDAANAAIDAVLPFYECARVPHINLWKMAEQIEKLFHNMLDILRIPIARRSTYTCQKRITEFKENLDKTMKFWPRNAMDVITNESDKQFLVSMMTDRVATMGSADDILSVKEKKIAERRNAEEERILREQQRKEETAGYTTSEEEVTDVEVEELEGENEQSHEQVTPKRSHKRVVKTGTTAFWPHNILKSPVVVETAIRNNISPTAMSAITQSLIRATSGDPTKVNLHYKTAYNYRIGTALSISTKIKESWTPPQTSVVHWDGKLMDTLDNKYALEERLPILLSGIGGVKLLGVPTLAHKSTDKTGPMLAKVTKELLDEWGCTNTVVGMTFDTTSSNTGQVTAGCISLQLVLLKVLLWLACRHHVGEVFLTHVFKALKVEVSRSPDVTVFIRFKENFESLSYKDTDSDMYIPPVPAALKERRDEIVKLCKDALKQDFVRGDYEELVKLTLMYLSDTSTDFIRPGALHKARWMAKMLYSIKMVLLSKKIVNELPKNAIFTSAQQQLPKLKKFVQYAVYCHVPWWLTAPVPSAAPGNDLNLINKLISYKDIDSVSADAALKAMEGHMWYLSKELVPLSLFSSIVTNETKQKIVDKLLTFDNSSDAVCSKRTGTGYGKPCFPKVPTVVTNDLSSFVGEDSWSFFKILKFETDFLHSPVGDWITNNQYLSAKEIVSHLCVVNDAAERGVKLAHDFLHTAKKEQNLQNVLQVVENNRNVLPNQRKRKRQSKNWFLRL